MMNGGELEVSFGRNKRCVHDIRYSQVHKQIIDGSPEELETILFSFKSGNGNDRSRKALLVSVMQYVKIAFAGGYFNTLITETFLIGKTKILKMGS